MPLSRQLKTHDQLVALVRKILAIHPGFYCLQLSPFQKPSPGYHRAGSWHIYPDADEGCAGDVNWKDPQTGSREDEHKWLMKAAALALEEGFSITFPLTPEDNARGTVANHCGPNLHLHIDCGSYSNIGTRTPAKGGAVTASIVGSALGYLVGQIGANHVANPAGATIVKGDRGSEVESLQKFLNSRSGVKPKIKVDGVFGGKTEDAVKTWQGNNRLVVDGRFGAKSKAKRRAQEKAAAKAKARPKTKTKTLRKGDRGALVGDLQDILRIQYRAYAGGLKPDKVFGPATEKAVKEFQRRSDLTVDGIVGPKTAKALGLKL